MRKLKFLLIAIFNVAIVVDMFPQTGMDWSGGTNQRYSRLRNFGGNATNQNANNEKAIGVYTSNLAPNSAIEVNTLTDHMPNFLNIWYGRGELFRTVAPTNVTARWRLIQGTTEKLQIYSLTGDNHIYLQASSGDLRVNAGGTTGRFQVCSNGYVGIGDYSFFTPKSMLHSHDGIKEVYSQFTNDGTTPAGTDPVYNDGFKVGISSAGVAEIRQIENLDLNFFTFNTQQATIKKNGFVGVGNSFTSPKAVVHVNANNNNTGEVFRTDGPSNLLNAWRLWTGTGVNASEKGAIFCPANSNDFVIKASYFNLWTPQFGNLNFETAGGKRMQILGLNGFIAIGDYSLFTPQSHLHMYGNGNQFMQVTNDVTGTTANDGLHIGLNSTSEAILNQKENADMVFYTDNTERMAILADGTAKITSLACENCFVMADENGKLYTEKNKITEFEARINTLENKITQLEKLIALNK